VNINFPGTNTKLLFRIDKEDVDGRYVVYFCIQKVYRRVALDGIVAISQIRPGLKVRKIAGLCKLLDVVQAAMLKESADPDESMEEHEVQVIATPVRENADEWMACKFAVKELDGNENFRSSIFLRTKTDE